MRRVPSSSVTVNSFRLVVKLSDRPAEQQLDRPINPREEDIQQIIPMDFEAGPRRRIRARLDAKAAECVILGVLELKRAWGQRLGPNSVEHAHALKNADSFAFDVDRRPAFA